MERPFPAYQGDEPYIFVSYAHEDDAIVYPELQWLKDQGFNIWYDEGIVPGHEWRQELAESIEKCSLFLYFVSPASVSSEHCAREVNYALDRQRPPLVVHLKETQLPSALAMSLSPIQAVLRHELSDLDYRIKLLRATSTHTERGISRLDAPVRAGFSGTAIAAGMVGTLLVCIVVAFAVWHLKPSYSIADQQLTQFAVDVQLAEQTGQPLAITPDGTRIIFNGLGEGSNQLFSRSLSELDATPIRGTEGPDGQGGAGSFALSPDSEWAVFNSANDLTVKKVRLSGGTPTTLTKVRVAGQRGLAWGPNDTIVITPASHPGLTQVSAKGGTAEPLTMPEEGMQHGTPHFLPEGHALLFTESGPDTNQVAFLSLESGEWKLLAEGISPQFTSSGHLLFYRDGALWAAGFDSLRGELTSEAVPVVEGLVSSQNIARYSISRDGTLVYLAGDAGESSELIWVDREGREQNLGSEPGGYINPRISPNGDAVVASIQTSEGADLWIYLIQRNILTRLTFDGAPKFMPIWSPDGNQVVYAALESPGLNLFSKAADGTGGTERLTTGPELHLATSWSSDGQALILHRCGSGNCDLARLSLEDGSEVANLLETAFDEAHPALSPDGKWLAYQSSESGGPEIYVRPYPDIDSGRWQVSRNGGIQARWGPDGRELFYLSLAEGMTVVSVETDPAFLVGDPTVLFDLNPYLYQQGRNYDIAADGDRFLIVKGANAGNQTIVVVKNWFAELERQVSL